jgi:tRNA pseudouridine13 synthase
MTSETQYAWEIPHLTEDVPGVGGVIRTQVEDFIVEEEPAYEPCGEGEHTYVRIEKRGISTFDVINAMAAELDVSRQTISSAGLKDTHAVARQTLSLHFVDPDAVRDLEIENVKVLWVSKHKNKLRPGHLRGNHFTIRIRDVDPEAPARVEAILDAMARRGVPNAYGPQRFGNRGDNHVIGLYLLRRDEEGLRARGIHHPSKRMRRFYVSALQSALFNQVLSWRIREGTMDAVILGDIAKKETTGGIFTVEDVAAEQPRVEAWEISPTGPMFGYKLMGAEAEAGAIEGEILSAVGLTPEDFRAARARGLRRPLRYNPEGLTWEMEDPQTLVVHFFAPKGSYATMLLDELMKVPDLH